MRSRLLGVALVVLCAVVALGCGDDDPGASKLREVTLALDFTPNAVQAPVFGAVREGADRRHGIRLRIREPGQGPDGAKLVASGRAQLALLDIHDLAIAHDNGTDDIVAIGALVGRPLAALLAQPAISRPRDLEGRTVGVSGLPSDPAFLEAIMRADGANADTVRQVTIGFSAVQRLLSLDPPLG